MPTGRPESRRSGVPGKVLILIDERGSGLVRADHRTLLIIFCSTRGVVT